MEDKENFWLVVYIAISAMFFSFTSWLNGRTKSPDYNPTKTPNRIKIQGITHALIGALIAVVIFEGLTEIYPVWSTLFRGSLAVGGGGLLGEAFIHLGERKLNNV